MLLLQLLTVAGCIDVFQLHGELDELHRQLNARRGAYGSSLSTVKLTAQAFKQFEKSADLIDGKVNGFSETAERMIRDGRCDSRRLRREVDDVRRKWDDFHRAIAEYRNALDDSAKFFDEMDNVSQMMMMMMTMMTMKLPILPCAEKQES